MSKKHFIALAQSIILWNKQLAGNGMRFNDQQLGFLADFFESQNPRFNRDRWLGYIAGTNGPSGGKL
jgi:hypothetical protein